jgi:prepilin-type N-terminal cleavage/methylation domain-containing protein
MIWKNPHHGYRRGFTLMELLVVMAILGILVTVGLTSYKSVQAKSRDARRKSDMRAIASALELYYNDYDRYPADTNAIINGCGTAGTSACAWGSPFQTLKSDGITVKSVYMVKLSADPVGTYTYYYDVYGSQGKGFQLYTRLENTQDIDLQRDGSNNVYYYTGTVCMTGSKKCNFGIASANLALDDASQGHTKTISD